MRYTSDLTIEQFANIEQLLPKVKTTRPRKWSYHEIWNAINYVLVSGCQRRNLPKDLPPWKTVYTYFRNWKESGLFDKVLSELHKAVRKKNVKGGTT